MSDQELWGLAYLAGGFFFSIVVGDWFIRWIMYALYEAVGPQHYGSHWSARVCGWVERALYTASWVVGRPEFIAVWLALKVAGTWQRWGNQREIYNAFLVGNGLCILYGVAGGVIIEAPCLQQKAVPVVGLLLGTPILWFFVRRTVEDELRRKKPPRALWGS